MRDFMKFIMYAGGALSIIAFALPGWGNEIGGVSIPVEYNRYLTFGGLAMVVIGFLGRRLTDSDDDY